MQSLKKIHAWAQMQVPLLQTFWSWSEEMHNMVWILSSYKILLLYSQVEFSRF